jgi:hypothetical protein
LDKVVENDKDSHGDNGRTKVCEACRLTTICSFRLLLLLQHSTTGLRRRTRNFFTLEKHIILNPNPKNKGKHPQLTFNTQRNSPNPSPNNPRNFQPWELIPGIPPKTSQKT